MVAVAAAVSATVVWTWMAGMVVGVVAVAGVTWWTQTGLRRERDHVLSQVRGWRDSTRPRSVSSHTLGEMKELAELLDRAGRDADASVRTLQADLPWRRELVAALPMGAVLFGADGYLVAANDQARELLRVPSDGERTTMVAALGNAQLTDAARRTISDMGVVTMDTDVAGRLIRADIVAVGPQRLVLVVDRTNERRTDDVRRNFVVNASHELKTPATGIQALAEALGVVAESAPERIPGLVARLATESQRLVRLVHDLLDLRRLEEEAEPVAEAVDLAAVVAQVVDDMQPWAPEREVTVATDVPGRVWVSMPIEDLELIVRNLVANAIQYNRASGRVTITVTDGSTVLLEVADTGLGIPRADRDRIFERFYRVDVARSRATGGTGLGLSMVRHAVMRNAGSIEVESLLGSGSVFRVHLPAGDSAQAAQSDPEGGLQSRPLDGQG